MKIIIEDEDIRSAITTWLESRGLEVKDEAFKVEADAHGALSATVNVQMQTTPPPNRTRQGSGPPAADDSPEFDLSYIKPDSGEPLGDVLDKQRKAFNVDWTRTSRGSSDLGSLGLTSLDNVGIEGD